MTEEQERTPIGIGQIALAADGTFSIYYYGEHAEQGGISFTEGNMGSKNAKWLFGYVAEQQEKYKDLLLNMVKEYWELKNKREQDEQDKRAVSGGTESQD